MFPPSLHKNIRELDKQITLLESECENMEIEKRKKAVNGKTIYSKSRESGNYPKKAVMEDAERPFVTGPRILDTGGGTRHLKTASAVKICPKSSVNMTKRMGTKRDTLIKSNCDHNRCTNGCNCRMRGSSRERSHSGNLRERKYQGHGNCTCKKESLNDFNEKFHCYETNDKVESENENQILHKGILHANPGGTIEVTVTQKSNRTPNNSSKGFQLKKRTSLLNEVEETGTESCIVKRSPLTTGNLPVKKAAQDQKWCQLLCQSNNIKVGDTPIIIPNLDFNSYDIKDVPQLWNNENECPQTPISSLMKKSRQKLSQTKKSVENVIDASPKTGKRFEEKEVQCDKEALKSCASEESLNPIRTIYDLIDSLKGNFSDEGAKCLLRELDLYLDKVNEENNNYLHSSVDDSNKRNDIYDQDNVYIRKLHKLLLIIKKICEKLLKEKSKLSGDLAVMEHLLSALESKEKEYLNEITNLKINLEKKIVQVEENAGILKEFHSIKKKLLSETKIADALRKSHVKMQEQLQKCMLENDKLKTEIRLNKLESQKFCVLLAGKDAEIKRYRDEVESFQRQITDQLAALRSNNAVNEVQKAMEAIIQHSQAFSATDMDSAFSETRSDEKGGRNSSKQRDKLVHSSPTSTKSSVLDSSWNHISSIHGDDSKININLDNTEDEVLIGDLRIQSPKKNNPSRNDANGDGMMSVPSFVSCRSVDSDTPMDDELTDSRNVALENLKASITAGDKLRQNIGELFECLKKKYCPKTFSIPSDSLLLDDLFNSSETSVLTDMSPSVLGVFENNEKS